MAECIAERVGINVGGVHRESPYRFVVH